MSSKSWQEDFSQTLSQLQQNNHLPRIAVVGIGHELRGDDAAGVVLARTLQELVPRDDRLLVVDAGPVPENVGGLLRRFAPDIVLFVDAAQIGEEAGAVQWLAWEDITGLSASTHTLPLHVLAAYLRDELGCEVALLGIQPADTTFAMSLSPDVSRSIAATAQTLAGLLRPQGVALHAGAEKWS